MPQYRKHFGARTLDTGTGVFHPPHRRNLILTLWPHIADRTKITAPDTCRLDAVRFQDDFQGTHDFTGLKIRVETVDVDSRIGKLGIGMYAEMGIAGNSNAGQFIIDMIKIGPIQFGVDELKGAFNQRL